MRSKPTSRTKLIVQGVAAGLLLLSAAFALAISLTSDPLAPGRVDFETSVRIEDRYGRLLKEFLSPRNTRREWLSLKDISPYVIQATLAAEDRRFFSHWGVDPLALARAVWLNLKHRRIISGASTITMQLARAIEPGPRTWLQKSREAWLALVMERLHSKEEILEAYLNVVPCGNLVSGVPAAARLYLDKAVDNLSPAEAAFLMSLPQAPTIYNPYNRLDLVIKRRNLILDRMAASGFLKPDQWHRAQVEAINLRRSSFPFAAPHFVTYIRPMLPARVPETVRTTIDLELQTKIEKLVTRTINRAKHQGVSQAAVVVMDHRTREILAWVGSADFFDPREGQNDGVTAQRQPGSAVKPLTYATAFDSGLTAATIIEDAPIEFGLEGGVYSPANYDRRFHGEVSLRTALASSLNVPAVKVLARVGLTKVYQAMKEAGLTSLQKDPDYYGLALTLGAGEVSLLELANAYATLAAGGLYRQPIFFLPHEKMPAQSTQQRRVFSPQAAYLVTDILMDDAARATGFGRDSLLVLPFPAAAKTGTSKNFRDNWTVGYTSSIVVAVWAGNFDARPMHRVSGITGAGPLWHQVMRLVADRYPHESFPRPSGLVERTICPETGLLATPACPNRSTELFMTQNQPQSVCARHGHLIAVAAPPTATPSVLTILSPRSGERYLYDPGLESGTQNLAFTAQTIPGLDTLVWYVNDDEVGRITLTPNSPSELFWPLRRGHLTVKLVGLSQDREVASHQVSITVN